MCSLILSSNGRRRRSILIRSSWNFFACVRTKHSSGELQWSSNERFSRIEKESPFVVVKNTLKADVLVHSRLMDRHRVRSEDWSPADYHWEQRNEVEWIRWTSHVMRDDRRIRLRVSYELDSNHIRQRKRFQRSSVTLDSSAMEFLCHGMDIAEFIGLIGISPFRKKIFDTVHSIIDDSY